MTVPLSASLPEARPQVLDGRLNGARCQSCGHALLAHRPQCPLCSGPVEPADFGPEGTVWSSTVVRIPVPGREPPYGLAYVDLDDGPRVLCHTPRAEPIRVGSRVRLVGSAAGDPTVEEVTA